MASSLTAYQLACLVHREQGMPVFPVGLRYDTAAEKWQKQPLVQWSQVSGDPEDVTWHGANAVGVPMGRRSDDWRFRRNRHHYRRGPDGRTQQETGPRRAGSGRGPERKCDDYPLYAA